MMTVSRKKMARGAECPSLPGCFSQGESREAVIVNIRETIESSVMYSNSDRLALPDNLTT